MKRLLAWLARLKGKPKFRVVYKPREYEYSRWCVQYRRCFVWFTLVSFRNQDEADRCFNAFVNLGGLVIRQSE